jgi:hypothetical protein
MDSENEVDKKQSPTGSNSGEKLFKDLQGIHI